MADIIKDVVFGEVEFEKNIWWRSMDIVFRKARRL